MSLVDSDSPSDEVNVVRVVEDGQAQKGCCIVKVCSEHLKWIFFLRGFLPDWRDFLTDGRDVFMVGLNLRG